MHGGTRVIHSIGNPLRPDKPAVAPAPAEEPVNELDVRLYGAQNSPPFEGGVAPSAGVVDYER